MSRSQTGFRLIAMWLGLFALIATLAACGGESSPPDDTSGGGGADDGPATTAPVDEPAAGTGTPAGDPVIIEASDPTTAVTYTLGQRVDVGQIALVGPVLLSVESIERVDLDGVEVVEVGVTFTNQHDGPVTGPDFYSVCSADGRVGFPVPSSTIQSLVTLAPDEQADGTVTIELAADCAEPLLQVRVLPVVLGNEPIAEYPIP